MLPRSVLDDNCWNSVPEVEVVTFKRYVLLISGKTSSLAYLNETSRTPVRKEHRRAWLKMQSRLDPVLTIVSPSIAFSSALALDEPKLLRSAY